MTDPVNRRTKLITLSEGFVPQDPIAADASSGNPAPPSRNRSHSDPGSYTHTSSSTTDLTNKELRVIARKVPKDPNQLYTEWPVMIRDPQTKEEVKFTLILWHNPNGTGTKKVAMTEHEWLETAMKMQSIYGKILGASNGQLQAKQIKNSFINFSTGKYTYTPMTQETKESDTTAQGNSPHEKTKKKAESIDLNERMKTIFQNNLLTPLSSNEKEKVKEFNSWWQVNIESELVGLFSQVPKVKPKKIKAKHNQFTLYPKEHELHEYSTGACSTSTLLALREMKRKQVSPERLQEILEYAPKFHKGMLAKSNNIEHKNFVNKTGEMYERSCYLSSEEVIDLFRDYFHDDKRFSHVRNELGRPLFKIFEENEASSQTFKKLISEWQSVYERNLPMKRVAMLTTQAYTYGISFEMDEKEKTTYELFNSHGPMETSNKDDKKEAYLETFDSLEEIAIHLGNLHSYLDLKETPEYGENNEILEATNNGLSLTPITFENLPASPIDKEE